LRGRLRPTVAELFMKKIGRRGQNTVEYLLMLTVIVGVVLIAGAALKRYIPKLFLEISAMITNAAVTNASAGTGNAVSTQ